MTRMAANANDVPSSIALECLVDDLRPRSTEMARAWSLLAKFASRRRWVIHGGWALHLHLVARDPNEAVYDESRLCTSGDFDVLSTDALSDLMEIAEEMRAETGLTFELKCTSRPNSFTLKALQTGVHMVDAWTVDKTVIDVLPTSLMNMASGPVLVVSPMTELVKSYYAMANLFTLPSFDLEKRVKRLTTLERLTERSAARVVQVPKSSSPPPNAGRQVCPDCEATTAALLSGGLGDALRAGEACLVGVCTLVDDLPSAKGSVPLDVACTRETFIEFASAACRSAPPGTTVRLHQGFAMCVGPSHVLWLEMYRQPDHGPVARIFCHLSAISCSAPTERPDGLAACTRAFNAAHLFWWGLVLEHRARSTGAASSRGERTLTASALQHVLDERSAKPRAPSEVIASKETFWDVVYDKDHFAGRPPYQNLLLAHQEEKSRTRQRFCVQFKTSPTATDWRLELRKLRGRSSINDEVFDGRILVSDVPTGTVGGPSEFRTFIESHIKAHGFARTVLVPAPPDERRASSDRKNRGPPVRRQEGPEDGVSPDGKRSNKKRNRRNRRNRQRNKGSAAQERPEQKSPA